MKRLAGLLVGLWIVLTMMVACSGGGSTAGSSAETSNATTVTGTVVDNHGQPVVAATVYVGTQAVMSAADGTFKAIISTVPASLVVLVKKNGYATNAKEVPLVPNHTTSLNIKLNADEVTHTLVAAVGGTVATAANASVMIAPNSILTGDGHLYTGNVTVAVNYINPDTPEGVDAFPQPYAGVDNGQQNLLRSVGVIEVKLTDGSGNALQLDPAKPATLTYPNTSVAGGAASIPLWYYDEAQRIWVRDGQVVRQGDGTYQGTVQHFTLWNADIPSLVAQGTMIRGCIHDSLGRPVLYGQARLSGSGFVARGGTGTDGNFEVYVPSGIQLTLDYYRGSDQINSVTVAALAPGEVRQLACQQMEQLDLSTVFNLPAVGSPVASYAGLYLGTFTGGDYGTFFVTISNNGTISGTGSSNLYFAGFNIAGSVAVGGAVSMSTSGAAGAATFTGNVDVNTGVVRGNWVWSDGSASGTFTGQKQ